MWPRPRPDSCGTATPHAATSGARMSETLSPTPPVECLSTFGRRQADRSSRSPERDHRSGPGAQLRRVEARGRRSPSAAPPSARRRPRRACRRRATSGCRLAARRPPSRFAADDVDGVRHRDAPARDRRHRAGAARSPAVNAAGSRSPSALRPRLCVEQQPGPPFSSSSCRHRPHGASGAPSAATTLTATSGPRRCRAQGADQPALGAQGQAVGRVLDVAAGDDGAIVAEPGRADTQPRIRRVRAGRTAVAAARRARQSMSTSSIRHSGFEIRQSSQFGISITRRSRSAFRAPDCGASLRAIP